MEKWMNCCMKKLQANTVNKNFFLFLNNEVRSLGLGRLWYSDILSNNPHLRFVLEYE